MLVSNIQTEFRYVTVSGNSNQHELAVLGCQHVGLKITIQTSIFDKQKQNKKQGIYKLSSVCAFGLCLRILPSACFLPCDPETPVTETMRSEMVEG